MFRGKNKDNRTASNSSVSLVDFEQVNVCWDVIESLLNDFWTSLNILCSKYYSHSCLTFIDTMLLCTHFFLKKEVASLLITY